MSGTLSATQDQTLISVDKASAYGIGSYDSNAMKSKNPKSGVYEADTSRTLDQNCGNPAFNQGGVAIVNKGVDIYNTAITGDTACSITSGGGQQEQAPRFCKAADMRNGKVCETNGALQAGALRNVNSNNTIVT